jgi:hypothetical protein
MKLVGGHRKEPMIKRLIISFIACCTMCGFGGVYVGTNRVDTILHGPQTPVGAVYQGSRLVYNPYKKSYVKESPRTTKK